MDELTDIQAIKAFFESGIHGRKVTMDELKKLSSEERRDIACQCKAALKS